MATYSMVFCLVTGETAMRNNIVHIGAGELTYEIRAIVEIADKLKTLGLETNMENIGDPIAKGEKIPKWMKQIVAELAMTDCSYGYCATKGVLETRQFLADMTNRRGRPRSPPMILFFSMVSVTPSRRSTDCCAAKPVSSDHHRPTRPIHPGGIPCRTEAGLLPPRSGQQLVPGPRRSATVG